jgi:hypothetical protein
MRKLVVVILTVGSLLLLEAPAWAPHLYSLSSIGTKSDGTVRFRGVTDCAGAVKVNFADGREGTAPSGAVSSTTNRRPIFVSTTGSTTRSGIISATCNGAPMALSSTLARTGVSAAHKLAFAAMLLAAGLVLVFLGRRQAGAGPS